MQDLLNNGYFWQKIDSLVLSTNVVISQKKGSHHPKYMNMVYPVDYGYLSDTDQIKVFKGSIKSSSIAAVMLVADILKRDLEVKLLWGCTEEEEIEILQFINQTDYQKGILVRRGNEMPDWALTD
ncbi:Inorganic pyrophosphatase [Erysipelothrix inopinata]|uniref:Inorganic pyrophosphatase n=1 Tax=Erysipelothrix inopinata TaxID=225084 RepID=A0A7G9S1H8_9FIRM|nr:Inorganic pyrophosphatase [Erysipelothrix inopinata]QNN61703.1 Inorganic pyrophosphatase [Erysipelothrix inopinata]